MIDHVIVNLRVYVQVKPDRRTPQQYEDMGGPAKQNLMMGSSQEVREYLLYMNS